MNAGVEEIGVDELSSANGVTDNTKDGEHATEKRLTKTDEAFDELMALAADSPEAKREAVIAMVGQIRQISAQMTHVRDMQHLQELKVMMLNNWGELKNLTGEDEALLAEIQAWGDKFVNENVLYRERIDAVKNDLLSTATNIELAWTRVNIQIGSVIRDIEDASKKQDLSHFVDKTLNHRSIREANLERDPVQAVKTKKTFLDDFLESLKLAQTGFDGNDLDVEKSTVFISNLNTVIRKLAEYGDDEKMGKLADLTAELQEQISEASKIFKSTQTINATHFQGLFNTGQTH